MKKSFFTIAALLATVNTIYPSKPKAPDQTQGHATAKALVLSHVLQESRKHLSHVEALSSGELSANLRRHVREAIEYHNTIQDLFGDASLSPALLKLMAQVLATRAECLGDLTEGIATTMHKKSDHLKTLTTTIVDFLNEGSISEAKDPRGPIPVLLIHHLAEMQEIIGNAFRELKVLSNEAKTLLDAHTSKLNANFATVRPSIVEEIQNQFKASVENIQSCLTDVADNLKNTIVKLEALQPGITEKINEKSMENLQIASYSTTTRMNVVPSVQQFTSQK